MRTRRSGPPAPRGFTLIELMMVVAIVAVLAAVAIPNFLKFQARAKQSEAKTNLKALFTAQRAFFQERYRYAETARSVGFEPQRGNRYAYSLVDGAPSEPRSRPSLPDGAFGIVEVDTYTFPMLPDGTTPNPAIPPFYAAPGTPNGGVPGLYSLGARSAEFLHVAVGNIDNDAETADPGRGYDSWFVSSESGTIIPTPCTSGTPEAGLPGLPYNTNNDVEC